MYGFIDKVLDKDMEPRDKEIYFDFNSLNFIRPVGVTVLNNIIGKLHKHGTEVYFRCKEPELPKKRCPMAFLDDSMFFYKHLKRTLTPSASLRPTTRPLVDVSYEGSYQYLDETISWLAKKLSMTKKSLGDVRMCLEEVFNNIGDHSDENNGSFFIQQFPKENKVMIAISDFGIGIPGSIQKKFPFYNDSDSLKMAIQQGFTTKSTPKNRGAGLDTLLHNVVINNKGSVYIHSNHGILVSENKNNEMDIHTKLTRGFYPGTLLEITFRTDTLEYIEEEYSWDT